jgi:Type II secretion system (T2SS), protein E, N-terminal domain
VSIGLVRLLREAEALPEKALFEALWRTLQGDQSSLVAQFRDSIEIDRQALSQILKAPGIRERERFEANQALMKRLPPNLPMRLLGVPIEEHSEHVVVAVADVRDTHALSEFAFFLGKRTVPVFAELEEIERAINNFFRPFFIEERPHLPTPMWASAMLPELDMPAELAPAASEIPIPLVTLAPLDIPFPLVARKQPRRVTGYPMDLGPTERPATLSPPPQSSAQGPLSLETLLHDPHFMTERVPAMVPSTSSHSTRGRDVILAQLQADIERVAARVAVFVIRKGAFRGWSCNALFGSEAALKVTTLPYTYASNGAHALSKGLSRDGYLGPVENSLSNAALLDIAISLSDDTAVWPVLVDERPAAVVIADGLVSTMPSTRRISELTRLAGSALEQLVRDARKP